MPSISVTSCPVDDDSLLLTPAVIITQARCEHGCPAAAWAVQFQWLMWGFAIVIDLHP